MTEQEWLTIAVDFGTTFTGVAWMTPRTPVQVINDWPGSLDRGERKVPTTLVYNRDGTLSSWGFMCADDDGDETKTRREFFKVFLDANILAVAQEQGLPGVPNSTAEAQSLMVDFLKQIYNHVKQSIEAQIGKRESTGWSTLPVKFLFSVPTTWTSLHVINAFKDVIREAGFGVEGPHHSAQIDLTEAEAASVATLKTSAVNFQPGSLFLTVDAGGGTTDLALMRVTSTMRELPQMTQVSAVRGIGIGASLIDRAFVRLVSQRLANHPDTQGALPNDCAIRMARSHHFKTLKHKFGEKVYMQKVFKIQMEGVAFNYSNAELQVENGRMLFTIDEIQTLFDMQIEGILRRIREQLDWIKDVGLPDHVGYMVLAGGLGSSTYVRESLQHQLNVINHPNAANIIVIPCQEPQLVVVRGLLQEHQQKLATGSSSGVIASRIARASYGVVVKLPYSPLIHSNEDLVQDDYDPGKTWAMNQIQWIIRKGDSIDPNAILTKPFEIWLSQGDTTRSWTANFVVSHEEVAWLPSSLKQRGSSFLCSVRSNLTGIQQHDLVLKHKRGSCFTRGRTWYICKFEVRIIVAPADLRFELWFGGHKFSGNHEPISVDWN